MASRTVVWGLSKAVVTYGLLIWACFRDDLRVPIGWALIVLGSLFLLVDTVQHMRVRR